MVSFTTTTIHETAVGYYEKLGFSYEIWEEPTGQRTGLTADSLQMTKII
jgi:hypothetical protein